ncbi:TIGR01440 family protein [Brevibacillus daliensis]|uniref:TIGR01440 family protein n=1 Tax=Brevibacillus daliensis TaxID=2892995 RepID=UPI0035A05040
MKLLEEQAYQAVSELAEIAGLTSDQIMVIGCSSSEVIGEHIGKAGSTDAAIALWKGISKAQDKYGFSLAFQCCEHLNRALVVESKTAESHRLEEVSVIPVPRAGGSMAAHAFTQMKHPVVVENILAHAGLDIGGTLIGMHLKLVAVPVRLQVKKLGEAHLIAARSRPKLIGGSRAVYEQVDQQACK